jgi:hypothetical protein
VPVGNVVPLKINSCEAIANPNPRRLSLTSSGCQSFSSKIYLEPVLSLTSLEPAPLSSPPHSPCAMLRDHGRSLTWAGDVVIPEPMTLCTPRHSWARDAIDPVPCPGPQLHHPLWARDTVIPVMLSILPRLWACNFIILPTPAMMSSLRHPRACDAMIPTSSMTLQHRHPPQARNATLCIFLCYFGPTNPEFDPQLWHATLLLFCCIDLICYIATLLWYGTFLLFCCIALIC